MNYIWDPAKKTKVARDHKVDFERIDDIFRDPQAIEFIDEEHSDENETRYGIIGFTAEYGLTYLVFVEVDHETTRFITARKAERWMVRDYEKETRRT
ncbi:MAG: BrnT family toxin [Pyrinomonadaceae bacterium]